MSYADIARIRTVLASHKLQRHLSAYTVLQRLNRAGKAPTTEEVRTYLRRNAERLRHPETKED